MQLQFQQKIFLKHPSAHLPSLGLEPIGVNGPQTSVMHVPFDVEPTVTSLSVELHCQFTVTKLYWLMTKGQKDVNNLLRVVMKPRAARQSNP